MSALRVCFERLSADEGATAVEYAMMAAFIGAVVVGVVAAIGIRVAQFFVIPWP